MGERKLPRFIGPGRGWVDWVVGFMGSGQGRVDWVEFFVELRERKFPRFIGPGRGWVDRVVRFMGPGRGRVDRVVRFMGPGRPPRMGFIKLKGRRGRLRNRFIVACSRGPGQEWRVAT